MAGFEFNSDYYCNGGGGSSQQQWGIQYQVITDLVTEPVDIAFFRQHIRVGATFTYEDTLLVSYLKAARQFLESWSQLSFGTKKIKMMALYLPKDYRMVYGPVSTININEAEHTNFGDVLKGGPFTDVTLNFNTSWPVLPEAVKVAICRYAAGLYMIRENHIFTKNGVETNPEELLDEAQRMLRPYMNITVY